MKNDTKISGHEVLTNATSREKRRGAGSHESPVRIIGFMGMVGWSVAIPLVLSTMGGVWLDRHWPQGFSWTLSLLFVGLIIGCATAWHWVDVARKGTSK